MDYSIGDVSKILNISKEMIRYYEKQGALKPSRKEENNYRTYSTMDVFFLMEMLRYQTMGLSVKDTSNLLKKDYMSNYANYLEKHQHHLQKEILYKMELKERLKEMTLRAKTSQMNIGKYWFKEIPSHDLIFLCNELNDEYDRISFNEQNKNILFNGDNFAFFESMVLFEEKKNTCWYGINQEYASALSLHYNPDKTTINKLCLCTMIDMGEIGKFSRDLLKPIYRHIEENGYAINGVIQGMIVCRGYQNDVFQRILEIQVPIKH